MMAARRRALAVLAASAAASAAAVAMVPRRSAAELALPDMKLDAMFPLRFGAWQLDPTVVPLMPSAEMQKVVAEAYDQTLARTYINPQGYRVMLSVAYGGRRNQGMDIHRPEICYPAQGLEVRRETRPASFDAGGDALPLKRLVAGHGSRNEPITYWLVIGRSVASFGYGHRLALLKYGLTGRVPDGMLVRISSIDDDEAQSFRMQDVFLRDMLAAVTPQFRNRLIGAG